MEDSALDFLLENMQMQISRLTSHQAEHNLLYEEMQFLRKFLKDSEDIHNGDEEVKDVVAKIGTITCKVHDMVDLFYLVSESVDTTPLSVDAAGTIEAAEVQVIRVLVELHLPEFKT